MGKTLRQDLTAQEFINVESISDDLLYSNDGYLFGYIAVCGENDKLLSDNEKEIYFSYVERALECEKNPWQILSIPKTVDTAGMIEQLAKLKKQTNSDAKLKLIDGEISAVYDMLGEGAKEPLIILKIWEQAHKGADLTLKKRLFELKSRLNEVRVSAEIADNRMIAYICRLFADLSEYHSENDSNGSADIPFIKGKEKNTVSDSRLELINMLTPVGGLDFKVGKVIVGTAVGRIYGAVRYPSEFDYGWAVDFMNCAKAVTSITFYPSNSGQLEAALSNSVQRNTVDAESTSDAGKRKKLSHQAEDADALLEAMEYRKESIGHVSILTMPFCSDETLLDDVCREVISVFSRRKIRMKVLGNLQKQAYQSISPYYVPQKDVENIVRQIAPLYTVVGGSPMTVSVFRDNGGFYFARTSDDGILAVDLLKRGGDRTNSNIVIMGKAGTGKSTALKHIMQTLFMTGVKILVIDPEREFKDLCKNLNGSWLDAGGGNAKINPLQIRPVPHDDDDDSENALYAENDNAMQLHIKTLEVFFSLYLPSLTDLQRSLLKKTVIELYNSCGIDWNTNINALNDEDFPIFSDLHSLLKKKSETDSNFIELAALLDDIANGADSFLWNGHTNIKTDNDFICFDTNKMNNASDGIKRTQYFNILTMCWEIMSKNRDEPVMLVCDEAYLMIDPNIPQSLMFLRNVEKRCRKYNGMLAVVSHSIVDFLDERIKMYGQSLLDIPTYKLFFGTDGKNLKETAGLFNLTEPEQNILQAGVQREALCMIGSKRIHVVFRIPDYKVKLMGSGGGR